MKLKTKLQVAAALALILFVAATNVFVYIVYENDSWSSEIARVTNQAEAMTEPLSEAIEAGSGLDGIIQANLPGNGMVRIIDQQEETIHTSTREPRFSEFPPHFTNTQDTRTWVSEEGERFVFIYKPIIWEDGNIVTLEVSERLQGMEANMEVLRYILVAASFIVLIPAVLGGWVLGAIILRPINRLIATMQNIQEKGNLKPIKSKRRSRDELQQLIEAFNDMVERLEREFEKQDQFVSDASHELRTPLTVIDGYATMLKRWGKTKPEVLDEGIDAITEEGARMKHLAEQLLLLVRDGEHLQLEPEHFQLDDVVRKAVRAMETTSQRPFYFSSETDTLFVYADLEKVKQVLYIILDNALKYSDKEIKVSVWQEHRAAYVAITDYGGGISEAEQARIFDRFYRINKARSREDGGTGLGLSIAAKLMEAQGGRITLDSKVGAYTTFTIEMPMGE
ncbi:HAMP domain-containing sensor histidine kinase [Natribacillus halophilus]|uniref:Signal transduction histidine-protein kinase ArlS n=1 Tax=Natribacillus halophilus TaxID=549003 RepID=A0A1G8QCD2_9BACI|nr:HAMP domain-containing histidine kinase [Natribacillus halophilus]SDJ02268.1 Signal transduction histidine kinase [Natribacillus halophilus]